MFISLRRMSVNLSHSSALRQSCCGNSSFPFNYSISWPSLRPKSRHLLLAQHHPEVPSRRCCPGCLWLLGNPADIADKKSSYFLTFFPVQGLQGHLQWEFRGLQQGNSSLKFPVQPRAHCSHHLWVRLTSLPITISIMAKLTLPTNCSGVYTLQAFDLSLYIQI